MDTNVKDLIAQYDNTLVDRLTKPAKPAKPAKLTKPAKPAKPAKPVKYERMVNGIGQSTCPRCGKWTNNSIGTLGHLCALGLVGHDVYLDAAPKNYVKWGFVSTAYKALTRGGDSRLVKAVGNDRVVHLPAHIALYPIRVVGERTRYLHMYWKSPAGLKSIQTGEYSRVPASVLADIPDGVHTAYEEFSIQIGRQRDIDTAV